jgi:hypothetical protein
MPSLQRSKQLCSPWCCQALLLLLLLVVVVVVRAALVMGVH